MLFAAFGAWFKLEQPHHWKPSFASDCFQNFQCHYSPSHSSVNIYDDVFYAEKLQHVLVSDFRIKTTKKKHL